MSVKTVEIIKCPKCDGLLQRMTILNKSCIVCDKCNYIKQIKDEKEM